MCVKIGNIVIVSKIKNRKYHRYLGKTFKIISFDDFGFHSIGDNDINAYFHFDNINNTDYEYELIREENLKYLLKCLE